MMARSQPRPKPRVVHFVLVPLALLALFSCTAPQTQQIEGPKAGGPGEESVNWDNPFGATDLGSAEAALTQVKFPAVVPEALGTATHYYVVPSGDLDNPRLVMVFENSPYGTFIVDESPSDVTDQATLDAKGAAGCDQKAGCEGTIATVTLDDGTHALEMAGTGSLGLLWLTKDVYFDLFGPPDEFTINSASTVANLIQKDHAG